MKNENEKYPYYAVHKSGLFIVIFLEPHKGVVLVSHTKERQHGEVCNVLGESQFTKVDTPILLNVTLRNSTENQLILSDDREKLPKDFEDLEELINALGESNSKTLKNIVLKKLKLLKDKLNV